MGGGPRKVPRQRVTLAAAAAAGAAAAAAAVGATVVVVVVVVVVAVVLLSKWEEQPKEPHIPRGDSGKDPPPVKQKPRSR